MNAFELYEAVFDPARDECLPEEKTVDKLTQEVSEYASGAFEISVDDGTCQRIAEAYIAFQNRENQVEGSNEYFHLVEKPLREIDTITL